MANTKVTVTPTGNEIIIRQGDAPAVYDPRQIEITGNIEAPATFVKNRKADIVKNKTNVVVDYDNLSIFLTVNEDDNFATFITGKLIKSTILTELGINERKSYSVSQLVNVLKLKRAYFKDRTVHATILKQLQEFTAKTETEFTSINDYKGNTALTKIANCKTNLSYIFTLNLQIYKAIPESTFDVEIEFEPKDGSIICWLVSQDLAELEIKLHDELMNAQLASFSDYVVIKK